MATDTLNEEVARIRWWHQMDLGQGVVTPGYDVKGTLNSIEFPEDLRGKTVLDIGAWDGFYSFEAERRGAVRVVAVDTFVWHGKSGFSKAGFELARRALKSKVEDREVEVLDISPESVGRFDVVLFLGVLYHMRHPLLALEKVFGVTKDLLILETHVDMQKCQWPVMRFYPSSELNGDASNWWGPNANAVVEMLRQVGFRTIKVISMRPAGDEQGRLAVHAMP